jgi:hypothetical protein
LCSDCIPAGETRHSPPPALQNIPVLPVVVGNQAPGEWLQSLHSVVLRKREILRKKYRKRLRAILSAGLFQGLIERFSDDRFAHYICGFLQEDRTELMTNYANEVAAIQSFLPATELHNCHSSALSGFVRQKGALSSFHIPDQPVSAKVWRQRYGKQKRTEHHRRLQRAERLALTRHAERCLADFLR